MERRRWGGSAVKGTESNDLRRSHKRITIYQSINQSINQKNRKQRRGPERIVLLIVFPTRHVDGYTRSFKYFDILQGQHRIHTRINQSINVPLKVQKAATRTRSNCLAHCCAVLLRSFSDFFICQPDLPRADTAIRRPPQNTDYHLFPLPSFYITNVLLLWPTNHSGKSSSADVRLSCPNTLGKYCLKSSGLKHASMQSR